MANKLLKDAKKDKKYEFYTLLTDIEKELSHYKEHFKNKTVFCNCDDPYESNFFKYFANNFNFLGLKKLIATCYSGSSIADTQLNMFPNNEEIPTKKAYKIEITEVKDVNNDGAIDLSDVEWLIKNDKNVLTTLNENGDFRSNECKELLKECDIVVSNPPFGLFREYLEQLVQYKKDYVIIGNTNALTYKEVFKLFKEDKIRTGYTNFNVGMFFVVPDSYEKYTKIVDGKKLARVSSTCWFTNLPVKKHNDFLPLYKKYSSKEYPFYDNYNAININTYVDIPMNYDDIMGVPVTFLDKYNPKQFDILGMASSAGYNKDVVGIDFIGDKDARPLVNGKNIFARIFIKRKK